MEEAEVMGPLPVAISAPPAVDLIHTRLPSSWISAEAVQNVTREAAKRILAAERKARRFQRDIDAVREEALRMLVRLKQTMDLKIAEAEKTSFVQTRRIKELESQLMEAEDTIKNLKSELNRASFEFGKKNVILEVSDPHILETQVASFQPACNRDQFKSSGSVCSQNEPLPHSDGNGMGVNYRLSNGCLQEMFGNSTIQNVPSFKNFNACNPDLAALILRCKETESYRNGCTQRIHAFEQNLLAEHWPHSGKSISGYSLGKSGIDATGAVEESFALSSAMNKDSEAGTEDANNPTQAREIVYIKGHNEKKEAGDDNYVEDKDLEEHTDGSAGVDHLSSRRDCISLSSAPVVAAKATQCEESSVNALAENRNIHCNTVLEMYYGPELGKHDPEATNDLDDSTTIEAIAKSNSLQNSDVNEKHSEPPSIPIRPMNDKLLKYTFHRKRKREVSFNKPEDVEEKKPCSRKRTARKPRSMHKPCGSSTVIESSRDSRRLVQVARQLISLSGRRW